MCGIAVSWEAGDPAAVRGMLDRLRHRGPAGEGLLAVGKGVLGHARLSSMSTEAPSP